MLQDLVLVDWGQVFVLTLGVILSDWKEGRLEGKCGLLAGSSSLSDFKNCGNSTKYLGHNTEDRGRRQNLFMYDEFIIRSNYLYGKYSEFINW